MRIRLEPLGQSIETHAGACLHDLLFDYGVEFPCGGQGSCTRCRVRVVEGRLEGGTDLLEPHEIAEGWRLSCLSYTTGEDVTLEVAQWEPAVLADDSTFPFTPREGFGIAVDLGTTTLVAQLVDLETGRVAGVRTGINPQAKFGADVMTRVQFALDADGARQLRVAIVNGIGDLIRELPRRPVARVTVAGNTVMHHLFSGVPVEPLAHVPFDPVDLGPKRFLAGDLGWPLPERAEVVALGCLGGFVGGDILAGIVATGLDRAPGTNALIDLGTNGEIVVARGGRVLCASTAAGPAFEGGGISRGMRAATGAISAVTLRDGAPACHVIGDGAARGICGSGLVDAVAAALDAGLLRPNGRFSNGETEWPLAGRVALTQSDVRELQLAKAAIAAGARLLLARLGSSFDDVQRVYLAGAFGNYINPQSARRIGMLEWQPERVAPAGNTALLGAKMALFDETGYAELRARVEHVALATDPAFQDTFVDCLAL